MIGACLVLLSLTAIWGLTFPLVQSALAAASPFVFLALRFALAALLFPLFVWPRAFRLQRPQLVKGLALGVFLWGGYALQTFGLLYTSAARSGFLTGTLVPMTPLFSWLLFRTQVGWRSWLAVLLALAGTAVMARPDAGGLNLGDVLTLLCAASFALQIVFVNRWSAREHEISLTWVQICTSGVLCALALPWEGPRLVFSPVLLWALLITAVLATAFALWAQMRFQPRISATAAAIIYAFEPVFAGLAAWMILGTVPGPATLQGAALIFAGMLLATAAPPEAKPHLV